MIDMFSADQVFDFVKSAWSQSVLVMVVMFMLYLNSKLQKNQEMKDQTLQSLILINQEQTQLMKEQNETIKEFNLLIVNSTEKILASVGKTNIDNKQLIYICKASVLSASFKKLDYLKNRLEIDHIYDDIEWIKKEIKSELTRISREQYIEPLNDFTCSAWLVGNWIGNNFPMDTFLEEIYKIFFDKNIQNEKKNKMFLTIMKTYQNNMWENFRNIII